jgi:hypothetical protein
VSSSRARSTSLWETIALEAARESSLWGDALVPPEARDETPVFSPLADSSFALGLESIYEGYLLHYGRARLFAPPDRDTAILLGDYLYAHGLVRIAALGDVDVVARLAELISVCTQLRAEGRQGDGRAWADAAASLSDGDSSPEAVETALAEHVARVD